jgi:outer membrane protein assembly factor BamB
MTLLACSCSSPNQTALPSSTHSQRVSVLTHHNDLSRTGANLAEDQLTPDVVRSSFGYLFSLPVDGFIYAQPLYVADLNLGPPVGTRDVLFVSTEHDSVYAFDANGAGTPLWQTSLGSAANLICFNEQILVPEIGITGTPVIDAERHLLYVVAFVQDDPQRCDDANFHQMIHVLDLTTGQDVMAPVEVTQPDFAPSEHLQRAALALYKGVLYVAFTSHQGIDPYHGWLFAYDASTLTQRAFFVTTPNKSDGGIWMAGQGPAIDADGSVFVSTGNGPFDLDVGGPDCADTLLKLKLGGGKLSLKDHFTPFNQAALQAGDLDLGSMGPLLIPGTHPIGGQRKRLVLIGGKEGKLYLLDRDVLGGFHADADRVLQTIPISTSFIYGGSTYFDDGTTARLFVWASEADLDMFELSDSKSGSYLTLTGQSTVPRTMGLPGGFLSLSANGTKDAIVWANHPWSPVPDGDANAIVTIVPGVLRAFDARDPSTELWDNRASADSPDAIGNFAKFCPPTVANGKVYFAEWQDGATPGKVVVFGQRSSPQ